MKIAGIVFLLSFGLYLFTAAPDITLVDGGELALAVYGKGVAHPPGVPLWLIIGEIFTTIIPLQFLYTLNIMSSFWMASAAVSVYLCSKNILAFLGNKKTEIPAIFAAIAFATSYNPWSWAGITEVYALNTFLTAGSWAAIWYFANQVNSLNKTDEIYSFPPQVWHSVSLAILLAMLGLANHHATIIIIFPALYLLIYISSSKIFFSARLWKITLISFLISLSLYLYLFLAAKNDTGLGWGGIKDLHTFLQHVTGQQFSHLVNSSLETAFGVMTEFFRIIFFGNGWMVAILVIFAIAELINLGWKSNIREAKVVLSVLVFAFALNLILSCFYIAGTEDRMAYDLPASVIWSLISAIGVKKVIDTVIKIFNAPQPVIMILLLTVPPVDNIFRNFPLCNFKNDYVARNYVEDTLGNLPQGALVFTSEWNLYSPYIYLRHAEGWRDDLFVIDILLLRKNWYLDYLKREMPEIINNSKDEFERFETELARFNSGDAYNIQTIQKLYVELMISWIDKNQVNSQSYTDWSISNVPYEHEWLFHSQIVPDNMLLRFVSPGNNASTGPLVPKDPVIMKIISDRLTKKALGFNTGTTIPRHVPYRKVWLSYAAAVEASLFEATRNGSDALEQRINSINKWFPDTRYVYERMISRK